MIELTRKDGGKVYLAPSVIAEIQRAPAPLRLEHISTLIRTHTGHTFEIRESVRQVRAKLVKLAQEQECAK